ncbi:unnamed protein product [Phytomonas sp. EM1]|nr:unnamed protein product [Phytomonas sp. EM1]|eukprot:CCW61477.1 unnamed protein product [Phytomonas sp. isolate EM1]
MPYRVFLSKFDFMEAAIENAELKPEDVIIVTDSDTIFTGVDLNPFLDRFIAQSAATPEELDALAVRQGRAMAPVLFSGDPGCWASNIFESATKCRRHFGGLRKRIRRYAAAHPEHEIALSFDSTLQRYVNSGTMIARVWAYKEFLQQKNELTKTQIPPFSVEKGWDCDQSVYTALFLDLITWEVEQDVLSMPVLKQQVARSPYGGRAGFYEIDYSNMLAGV